MKKIFLTTLFIVSAIAMSAQNSAITKANEAMHMGKWEKALDVLKAAETNPKTTKFAELYRNIGICYINIFQPELAKAANQEPFDTILYCDALDKSFEYLTKSHEADFAADKKGKKGEFEAMNKLNISQMMDFYNYAGQFASMRGDLEGAAKYFEKYYDLPKNPVFSPEETQNYYEGEGKDNYNQALFNIALLNYQTKNWDKVIEMANLALDKYPKGTSDLYLMLLQATGQKKDSVAYFNVLEDAIVKTENKDLSQQMLYELVHRDKSSAMVIANQFVERYPNIVASHYVRGYMNLNIDPKNYAEAEADFKAALQIDPNDIESNLKLSYTYMNDVAEQVNDGRIKLPYAVTPAGKAKYEKVMNEQVRPYYEKARPYLEKVKGLIPSEPERWAADLKTVYTNLNMAEEAKAMEQYLY
ncbi:MAG: tetratricopeptide repeat protein [Alloprevotella sp.]|nr:tetratricopeptide repeat protein [Alloprevotella sp.]